MITWLTAAALAARPGVKSELLLIK